MGCWELYLYLYVFVDFDIFFDRLQFETPLNPVKRDRLKLLAGHSIAKTVRLPYTVDFDRCCCVPSLIYGRNYRIDG